MSSVLKLVDIVVSWTHAKYVLVSHGEAVNRARVDVTQLLELREFFQHFVVLNYRYYLVATDQEGVGPLELLD